jgi:centrosomal protein CEP135
MFENKTELRFQLYIWPSFQFEKPCACPHRRRPSAAFFPFAALGCASHCPGLTSQPLVLYDAYYQLYCNPVVKSISLLDMPPKATFRPGAAASSQQQHTAFTAPVVASSFEVVDSSDIALQLNALNIHGKVTGEAVGVVQQLLDMLAETSMSSNELKGAMDELRSEVKQSRAEVEPLKKENSRLLRENQILHSRMLDSAEANEQSVNDLTAKLRASERHAKDMEFLTVALKGKIGELEEALVGMRQGVADKLSFLDRAVSIDDGKLGRHAPHMTRTAPAPSALPPAFPSRTVDSQSIDLVRLTELRVETLQKENESLKTQTSQLQSQLQEATRQLGIQGQQLEQIAKVMPEVGSNTDILDLQDALERDKSVISHLHEQVDFASQQVLRSDKMLKAAAEAAAAREAKMQSELRAAVAERDDYMRTAGSLKQRLDELVARMPVSSIEGGDRRVAQSEAALRRECEELRHQLQITQQRHKDGSNQGNVAAPSTARVDGDDVAQLKQVLSSVQREFQQLIETRRVERMQHDSQVSALQSQIQQLQQDLEHSEVARSSVEDTVVEMQNHISQNRFSQQQQSQSHQTSAASVASDSQQVSRLKDIVRTLNKEFQELAQARILEQQDHNQEIIALKKELHNLQETNEATAQENRHIRADVSAMQEQFAAVSDECEQHFAEIEQKDEQISSLKEAIHRLEQEQSKAVHSVAQQMHTSEDLQRQSAAYGSQVSDLKRQLDAAQNKIQSLQLLAASLDEEKDSQVRMLDEKDILISQLQRQLQQLQQPLDHLKLEVRRYEEHCSELRDILSEKDAALRDSNSTAASLRQREKLLGDRCDNLQAQLHAALGDLGNLTRENQSLNEELQNAEVARDSARCEYAAVHEQLETSIQLIRAREHERDDVSKSLRMANTERTRLRESVEALSEQLSLARKYGSDCDNTLTQLTDALEVGKQTSHRLSLEIKTLEQQNHGLASSISGLHERNQTLVAECDRRDLEIKRLRDSMVGVVASKHDSEETSGALRAQITALERRAIESSKDKDIARSQVLALQERLAHAESTIQEVRSSHREQLMRLHESQQLAPSAAAGDAVHVKLAHAEAAANLAKQENQELQQQVSSDFGCNFFCAASFFSSASTAETRRHSRGLVQLCSEGRARARQGFPRCDGVSTRFDSQ